MHEITEFKGNKILVLKRTPEDSWPFSFGLGKAKLILENLDAIKSFVGTEGTTSNKEESKDTKLKIDISNEMPETEEEMIE